jgi:hypothetical protein
MEDWVDVPGHGEAQLGGNWGYQSRNDEGTVALRREFDCAMRERKILPF